MAVYDSEHPLGAKIYANAVVYPTVRAQSNERWFRERLFMGVYDGEGEFIPGSELERRAGERGAAAPRELFPEPVDAETPEALYGGTLYFHFGHFLVESLARAWYYTQFPDLPIVWAGAHNWTNKPFEHWQLEILEILGVTNPVSYVSAPTRFATLHIPDVGYHYDDWFHPQHARFLAQYEGPEQEAGRKLWLSRSKLATDVRDLNAPAAESRLAALGWDIEYPEQLTVREQLDRMARAETIAGEEGSAFHLLMLLKDVAGKHFVVLRRKGTEHRNMTTIGDARDVDQRFVTLDDEAIVSANGREVTKLTPSAASTLDALGEPTPLTTSPKPDQAEVDLLQRVGTEIRAERFLDYRDVDGAVFRAVDFPVKEAVSPIFAFDSRQYRDLPGSYYELDFDSFVAGFAKSTRFDLIRVGGSDLADVVHGFDKTRRVAHKHTLWLLRVGGETDRVASLIRQFFPGFTAFAPRSAPGTALVWRLPERARTIDEVSGLDSRDFRRYFAPRRHGSERAALSSLAERLRTKA